MSESLDFSKKGHDVAVTESPIRFEKLQEVVLAEPRGFCAGVERAIDIADIVTGKQIGRAHV